MTSLDEESPRLVSLDAFRGATIALMVLVNNAGSGKSYSSLLLARAFIGVALKIRLCH